MPLVNRISDVVSVDTLLKSYLEKQERNCRYVVRTLGIVVQYLPTFMRRNLHRSWMKYSHLWTEDKTSSLNEFSSRKPELSNYEEKFDFYSNICNQIERERSIVEVCCVKYLNSSSNNFKCQRIPLSYNYDYVRYTSHSGLCFEI